MVAGIKEMLQGYEGTPAELNSESGRAPTPTPQEILELVKSFTPVEDIENITEAGNLFSKGEYGTGLLKTVEGGAPLLAGAIGTAIGTPALGAATYGGTKAAIKGGKKILNTFTTSRGSKYDFFDDGTTIRNRSGKDHRDKSEGIQSPSVKTFFVDEESLSKMGGFQNTDTATQILPILDKDNKAIGAKVVYLEDYGPYKKGTIAAQIPIQARPQEGLYPVEIWSSISPLGDAGSGIHFGNKIMNVDSMSKKKKGGSVVERNPYNNYKPKAI